MSGQPTPKKKFRPTNIVLQTVEEPKPDRLSASGSYNIEDVKIGKDGVKIASAALKPAQTANHPAGPIKHSDLRVRKEALGSGLTSSVHLAKHAETGELFALKVIQLDENEKNEGEKMKPGQLAEEIKNMYHTMDCPYVVKFYEAYCRDSSIKILLEYMDCGAVSDVRARVPRQRFSEPVVAEIIYQILKGLEFLKSRHIIHRDLKPQNCLCTQSGRVALADFGMSKKSENSMANFKTFQGTISYMSPERIKGQSYGFDSDLWSVGIMCAEMALGRLPFRIVAEQMQQQHASGKRSGKRGREQEGVVFNLDIWALVDTFNDTNRDWLDLTSDVDGSLALSDSFVDFVHGLLRMDPQSRPSIAQCLQHPFIVNNLQQSMSDEDGFRPVHFEHLLRTVYLPRKREEKERKEAHAAKKPVSSTSTDAMAVDSTSSQTASVAASDMSLSSDSGLGEPVPMLSSDSTSSNPGTSMHMSIESDENPWK